MTAAHGLIGLESVAMLVGKGGHPQDLSNSGQSSDAKDILSSKDQAAVRQALAALPDEQLITRHLAGEDGAFEALVERYRVDLFRFLMRFMNNRAAADDVFQNTFMQVHQSAATFDVEKRFKPWLYKIAANKARDLLRRNKRRRAASLDAEVGTAPGEGCAMVDLMEADVPNPHAQTSEVELGQMVQEVVSTMPDHLREVINLAYFQQLPYKQVAEMLNIPLGTVKSRLHAAVGTFAKLWKAKHGDQNPIVP